MLVPWGGGGLTTGIASALAAVSPSTTVFACEPETGAPVTASLAAGEPTAVDYTAVVRRRRRRRRCSCPRCGSGRDRCSRARFAVSLDETAAAVRLLAERARVIAEGAGALAVAAALSGRAGEGRIVCIVSGGNIDADRLAAILEGRTPS